MEKISSLIRTSNKVVIIQADNPDGDSLSSALALEHILSDLGKEVYLYCGVDIPTYLRYLNGWDRVANELPKQFDASIIVDTNAINLLESLQKSGEISWIRSKPCIVIDHHKTESTIDFATASLQEEAVSTGELIYRLAATNGWAVNQQSASFLVTSILSDSLGLTSESVTASSIRTLAELVEKGVSLASLDELRKSSHKKTAEILNYKGALLQRIEYESDQRIALIHIPWKEIEKFSHAYNPSMLVLDEMRMVENVRIAIALKTYPDGKITAKIRSNFGIRIAAKLAEHFGGGGHPYAAGFKITNGRNYDDVRNECIAKAAELLDTLDKDNSDETIQHAQSKS